MKRRSVLAVLVALTGFAVYAGVVRATPQGGFVGTTIAKTTLAELDTHVHTVPASWQVWLKTKGLSDLYVQSNVWQAGGTTGWHTHPGPSLVIVTAGTLTVYDGDEPGCAPHVYTPTGDNSFVDVGGGDVHLIRNEGTVEARTIAVQFVPAGATRRIDADAPAGCPSG
jgi:quercetin dioxygenase-like cupin family protein